jgi:hypothetical protein
MQREPFGEIVHDSDAAAWIGRVRLPEFAIYGRDQPSASLGPPDDRTREGLFELTVRDSAGTGPTQQQANAVRYLIDNEPAVCRAVLSEILASQRYGGVIGWLNRKLGLERQTPEELHNLVRCVGVTVSDAEVREYAHIGFDFDVDWVLDLSVVFHPAQGACWGDRTAIDCI